VPEVRFRKVDETTRQDHYYLQPDDECYFLYEYTAHAGWQHATNQLIFNLKKKLGAGGYHYKAPAIARCAAEFTPAINDAWLASAAFVPVPPSKAKGDPLYDDRMVQVCRKLNAPKGVNVREVIEQITSTDPSMRETGFPHNSSKRTTASTTSLLPTCPKTLPWWMIY
jgi:hypothetical protein